MGQTEDDSPSIRGIKRKRQEGAVKLTFAQRLAAAQKAPKQNEPESEAEVDEKSSVKLDNSSDVEDSYETARQIETDECFRKLYIREINFSALAEKDDEFSAWYVINIRRHLL